MNIAKLIFSRVLLALAIAIVVGLIKHAFAQGVPIGALPTATLPLSGSEYTILSQNGTTVKATVTQVVAPSITIPNNNVLGNVSGATHAAVAVTAVQLQTMLGLGSAAYANVGASGHSLPFLDTVNTWSAMQTLVAGIAITGGFTADTLHISSTSQFDGAATFSGAISGSPASANVTFSPTGTGTVTINPATVGHLDNTIIGSGTRAAFSATTGSFNSTLTFPTPFTLGATSVTSTGTQLNYLTSATGTTGTATTNLVFSASPTFSGTVGGSNILPLAGLAQTATNTVVGNATSGLANVTALAVGTCSTSASALIWTTNTGFGCNTAVNAAQLGGATFAAPAAIGTGTPAAGTFTLVTASTGLTLSGTTAPVSLNGSAGTSGNVLLSAGAGATPTWGSVSAVYPAWAGAPKTVAFNAVAGTRYCIDTLTTGAVTMTLPASPADGDQIAFLDCKSNFGVANFTVARNGKTIMGSASDMTVATPNATSTLVYSSTLSDWRIF